MKDEYVQANLFKGLTKEEKKNYILSMDFTEVKLKSGKCYTCGAIDIRTNKTNFVGGNGHLVEVVQ